MTALSIPIHKHKKCGELAEMGYDTAVNQMGEA
jgi:hypothetical protein